MSSLIDQLTAMEAEAETLIEQAKAEAEIFQDKAEARIETIKKDLSAELDQKILAFRSEAQANYEKKEAAEEDRMRKTLAALDSIPSEALSAQVDKLVALFREI